MVPLKIATRPGLLLMPSPESPAERAAEKRRIRKHQVFDAIRRLGPISRIEVSRAMGFNLPTVSLLVDELVAEGLATEAKAKKTAIGRRPIPVSLNSHAACVMGIEVGKSATIGLLMNLEGTILARVEHPSPEFTTPQAQSKWVESFVTELFAQQAGGLPPLAGVGIALPGLIHRTENARQLLEPEAEAIRSKLAELLDVPVLILNNANMMALGVLWFEPPKDAESFATINLGEGLGLGVVSEGRLFSGARSHAGEIGHLALGEQGVPCYCGGNACLENTASGSGLRRLAARAGILVDGKPPSPARLAEMARGGDEKAQEVYNQFAAALARGVGAVINLFNPAVIVLVGAVSRESDIFLPRMQEELERVSLPGLLRETRIAVSGFVENAAPIGSCACVLNRIFNTTHISAASVI